jgi:hypothetical protein
MQLRNCAGDVAIDREIADRLNGSSRIERLDDRGFDDLGDNDLGSGEMENGVSLR